MELEYKCHGTCSKMIYVNVDDNNIIQHVMFYGGCNGNTKGVARLVEGMDAHEAIKKLEGITCGPRPTSCPDQLSKALKTVIGEA